MPNLHEILAAGHIDHDKNFTQGKKKIACFFSLFHMTYFTAFASLILKIHCEKAVELGKSQDSQLTRRTWWA